MTASTDGDADRIAAVIFDMDGVVTDTAEAHFATWKHVFDALLASRDTAPFTRRDYLAHLDGVSRHEGVCRFLSSRNISLPEGEADDAGPDTMRGLGNLKNQIFADWLREHPVPVFDDAVEMVRGLKVAGVKVAVFSDGRNAARVLRGAGLDELFDATVDGTDAEELDLGRKPDPGQLIEAARRLGAAPAETAVIEGAVAGVQAGAAGRFALVIGVTRLQDDPGAQRHALRANGADLVVRDLRRLLLPEGGGLRTLHRLPLVWDRLEEIGARVEGRRLAVFLDFDGTLSPIVADYRDAAITEETRSAIRHLSDRCPVAIISGRDLKDVQARVGIEDAIYAGSHGFDIAGPGGLKQRPEAAEGFLQPIGDAHEELRAALAEIDGASVERKTFSVAVHYREVVEDDVSKLEAIVDRVVGGHDKLRKGRGKKVIEIQPRADWDKGRAVDWLLSNTPLGENGALPLYLGDDLTDEDAFATLDGRGICIAVRGDGRATLADYTLDNPDDVRRFLGWLSERAEASQ